MVGEVLVASISAAALLMIAMGLYVLIRGVRNASAVCIAGFAVPVGLSYFPTFTPLGQWFEPKTVGVLLVLLFAIGFSFIFALVVVYGQERLSPVRRLMILASAWPILAAAGLLVAGVDLAGETGALTLPGLLVFYLAEAFGAMVPFAFFGWKWYRSAPGPSRESAMWLTFPFLFWMVHDGLINGVFAHVWPERYPLLSSYPEALIPLNIFRVVAAAGFGIVAWKRHRSANGSHHDGVLAWFTAAAFILSIPQIWSFLIHVLLNQVMMLGIMYGVARNQVLNVDLRLKTTVGWTTALAVALPLALLAREVAEVAGMDGAARTLAAVTGGLAIVAVVRWAGLSRRVEQAVLPNVAGTSEYLDRRRLNLYWKALLEAAGRGPIDENAAPLVRLRAHLGINVRDHQVLALAADTATRRDGNNLEASLGRYRLMEIVGQGAHGTVHRAIDRVTGDDVACKVLRPGSEVSEAVLMARVQSPHVVPILGVESGPPLALIMPWYPRQGLDGQSLSEAEAVAAIGDMLQGLRDLHSEGILHMDLKPSNLLASSDGRVQIADMGLALEGTDATIVDGQSSGTLAFMAPEVLAGAGPSKASDVYSAAATAYALLTGGAPVPVRAGESPMAYEARRWRTEVSWAAVPDHLRDWLRRAMALSPADRISDGRAALGEFLDSSASLRSHKNQARTSDAENVAGAHGV